MPFSTFRCFLLSIFSLALLLSAARTAGACTCGLRPTVLDAFEEADDVIIARAISLDKLDQAFPPPSRKIPLEML